MADHVAVGQPGVFFTLNSNADPDGHCSLTYSQEAIGKEFAALGLPKKSLLKPLFDNK